MWLFLRGAEMNTIEALRWLAWSAIYLGYPLFVVWKLSRIAGDTRRAGAVLFDLGVLPLNRRYRWGYVALVCTLLPMLFLGLRMFGGESRAWFQELAELLLPLAAIVYPIGTTLFLSRKLCERGLLWNGELIPWALVAGWKETANKQGLQIDVRDPSWGRYSLPISAEQAREAAEILTQYATETSRLAQPSVP